MPTSSTPTLTIPMRSMLWEVAQMKYGWKYISRRRSWELQVADALVRRGLIRYGESHGRDHYDCPEIVATDEGRAEIERRWPISPFALDTYQEQPGGWQRPDGTQCGKASEVACA